MIDSLLAWLRLLRLPNHATAVADVLAGFLIVSHTRSAFPQAGNAIDWPAPALWWAILASLGFYGAGMVLNDVFDLEIDRAERPERPLPSGRIRVQSAAAAGNILLTIGSAAACATALAARNPWPAFVGALLTAAVWIYNRYAKATSLGPVVMGSCRSLNWLLGMTAAGGPTAAYEWLLPIGMGVYVMGITLYSRDEAEESDGAWFGLAGAGAAKLSSWLLLWGVLAASILLRTVVGIFEPTSGRVQQAVGNAIMSIITLDAVLVLATCGEPWAIVVLVLLAPFLLGRRLVSPT